MRNEVQVINCNDDVFIGNIVQQDKLWVAEHICGVSAAAAAAATAATAAAAAQPQQDHIASM